MKNKIIYALIPIACAIIVYLTVCFINYDFDLSDLEVSDRFIMVWCWICLAVLSTSVYIEINKK